MLKKLGLCYGKYLIIVLGIAFICFGILRKEHIEELQKAINVCLECIGVG